MSSNLACSLWSRHTQNFITQLRVHGERETRQAIAEHPESKFCICKHLTLLTRNDKQESVCKYCGKPKALDMISVEQL